MTERSKLTAEVTSNYSGNLRSGDSSGMNSGDADATNEFIAVTVLVATRNRISQNQSNTSEELRESLRVIGSISASERSTIRYVSIRSIPSILIF